MDDDLVQFLRARLDEEAAEAQEAGGAEWMPLTVPRFSSPGDLGEVEIGEKIVVVPTPDVALHIARHDPARVLAEVEAKRQLLTEYTESEQSLAPFADMVDVGRVEGLRVAVAHMALPYADRPGYRDE